MPPLKHPADHVKHEAARLLHDHHGNLSLHEFSRLANIPVSVIQLRLGPWLKFKQSLGYDTGPKHSPQDLLQTLRNLIQTHGPDIRLIDFTAATGLNEKVVTRAFGTWRNFRTQAGLTPNPVIRKRIPDEAFFADLLRVSLKLDRICTPQDYDIHGESDLDHLEAHFGSWTRAIEASRKFFLDFMQQDPTGRQINDLLDLWITQLPKHKRRPRLFNFLGIFQRQTPP